MKPCPSTVSYKRREKGSACLGSSRSVVGFRGSVWLTCGHAAVASAEATVWSWVLGVTKAIGKACPSDSAPSALMAYRKPFHGIPSRRGTQSAEEFTQKRRTWHTRTVHPTQSTICIKIKTKTCVHLRSKTGWKSSLRRPRCSHRSTDLYHTECRNIVMSYRCFAEQGINTVYYLNRATHGCSD